MDFTEISNFSEYIDNRMQAGVYHITTAGAIQDMAVNYQNNAYCMQAMKAQCDMYYNAAGERCIRVKGELPKRITIEWCDRTQNEVLLRLALQNLRRKQEQLMPKWDNNFDSDYMNSDRYISLEDRIVVIEHKLNIW